jgi:hypothetical protein
MEFVAGVVHRRVTVVDLEEALVLELPSVPRR